MHSEVVLHLADEKAESDAFFIDIIQAFNMDLK